MWRVFTVAVVFLALCLELGGASGGDNSAQPVSLIQLISTPERYNNRLVFGVAFLELSTEGALLYIRREDSKHVILTNAIWVEPSKEMIRDREKLDLKYVKFVGTFHAGHGKEHSYYQAGGITGITSCTVWSDPANPLRQSLDHAEPHPQYKRGASGRNHPRDSLSEIDTPVYANHRVVLFDRHLHDRTRSISRSL